MEVRIVESDGGRGVLWILEFPYPLLETFNVLPQQLRPRLALAIVVLTTVWFLCTDALLAGRLEAIASLHGRERTRVESGRETDHFSFSGQGAFEHESKLVARD